MQNFQLEIDNNLESIEVKKLNIVINNGERDVEYRITVNNFGELEIQKQTFNDETSTMSIMPHMSNHILLK